MRKIFRTAKSSMFRLEVLSLTMEAQGRHNVITVGKP